jgi:hypothetical protein
MFKIHTHTDALLARSGSRLKLKRFLVATLEFFQVPLVPKLQAERPKKVSEAHSEV